MKKITLTGLIMSLFICSDCIAQPGMPDTPFGNYPGWLIEAQVNQPYSLRDFYVQEDGKIIAVGNTNPGQSNNSGAVVRFHDNGDPDFTFGFQGHWTTSSDRYFYAAAAQSDGKIVAVGTGKLPAYPFTNGLLVRRCLPDGTNDTTFGTSNASFIYTAYYYGKSILVLEDDTMLVGAWKYNSGAGNDFAIIKLNANGTIDTSYGTNGATTIDFIGGPDEIDEMHLTSDGKLLLFGKVHTSPLRTVMAKLNADGSLDTGFGNNGKLIFDTHKSDMAFLPNDGFFLTGAKHDGTQNNGLITKYKSDGTVDTNFADDGSLTCTFPFETAAGDMEIDHNDNLIVGLNTDDANRDWIVAKYSPDGILDTSFGEEDGYTEFYMIGYGNYTNLMHTVRIQPDNKILVGTSSYGFVIARFNSDPIDPNLIKGDIIKTNVTCNGQADGTAAFIPATGTAPYTYQWLPSGGTEATAIGLAPGNYSVIITDANNHTVTRHVMIKEPQALNAEIEHSDALCYGTANGTATAVVSGGVAPYTYLWDNDGGTAATATGLAAGTHTVTVTDATGCNFMASILIMAPEPLAITAQPQDVLAATGGNASFSIDVPEATAYQWQVSTNGTDWNAIAAGGTSPQYTGTDSSVLQLASVPFTFSGYRYRAVMSYGTGCTAFSDEAVLTVQNSIQANGDDFTSVVINEGTGGIAGNIILNDVFNGGPATVSNVILSITDDGGLEGVAIDEEGMITVPASAEEGMYLISYSICDAADVLNCSTAHVTILIAPALNVADETILSYTIYPNPASSEIVLQLPKGLQNKKLQVTVYDVNGRKVLEEEINTNPQRVDIARLQSGAYLFILDSENSRHYKVLIKE